MSNSIGNALGNVLGTSPTTAPTSNSAASNSTSAGNPSSQLGESAFLQLLSAELKYQNPLKPMNNTQFVAELAQFSQLSATTSTESTLKSILTAVSGGGSNAIVSASQLIGKTVTTSAGSGQVTSIASKQGSLTADVKGLGTINLSDITGVSG